MRVNGRYLHSKYDPLKEADRVASEYEPTEHATTLFVLGEGIPYCALAIAKRRTELVVHAITLSDEAYGTSPSMYQHPVEDPTTDSIRRLVRRLVHPLAAGRVDAMVWPPAERCMPQWIDRVRSGLLAGLEDTQSQLATTASFGRLWIKNALRRTVGAETRREIIEIAPTITVIGGGPSLETGLPAALRSHPRWRNDRTIAAATSATRALTHRGVVPDLLFHADAGFWAQRYRETIPVPGEDPPAVVSLRSSLAPGSPVADDTDIFLQQGWFGESIAPDHKDWVAVPEFPTVSATIVSFLDTIVPEPQRFELLGVDLCSYDGVTHARPHQNERYIDRVSSRLLPPTTAQLLRAGVFSESRRFHWDDGTSAFQTTSLSAFVEPLTSLVREVSQKHDVRHLHPSPVWRESALETQPSFSDWTTDGGGGGDGGTPMRRFRTRLIRRPGRSDRVTHAVETLEGWRATIEGIAGVAAGAPLATASALQLDLLLHIAPVRTLQAIRCESSIEDAITDASVWLDRLVETVRDGHE